MSPVPAWKVYSVLVVAFFTVFYAGSMVPREGELVVKPVASKCSCGIVTQHEPETLVWRCWKCGAVHFGAKPLQ